MSEYDDIIDATDREERLALIAVADLLERDRPLPAAGFRSRLKGSLVSRRTQQGAGARARILALSCACLGGALIVVAALGTVAVGPFAA